MSVFICRCVFAVLCFAYIVFAGLAHDYEAIGHGLIPVISIPVAIVMVIFAVLCYRLAFVTYPKDDEVEDSSWPVLNPIDDHVDEQFHH